MELQIKKWGVLRDSTIPLPGLTVITGYNATGKSTVGKLLLAMVKNFRAAALAHGENLEVPKDFPNPFLDIFGRTVDRDQEANFVDRDGRINSVTRWPRGFSRDYPSSFSIADAFLIETPFVVVLSKLFQQVQQYASSILSGLNIAFPYSMNDVYGKLITPRQTISESGISLAQHISDVVNGYLEFETHGPVFVEKSAEGERRFDPKGVASGQLGLAVFAKLLENGWVANDTISIFDEPESHMHPHWQLIYADLLVRCVEELGATIVVTTHTPYMLQALKVFSDQRIKDKAAFCLAERKGDHAQITVDDSPDLDRILPLMTDPMERIQLLKVWDDES